MQGGIFVYFLVLLASILLSTNIEVDASSSYSPAPSPSSNAKIYIVILSEKPPQGLTPHAYYIKVLSLVLGSEKAAKDALIYSYRLLSGFSAKLSPDQASRLKSRPGIVYVNREIKYWTDDDHINASSV